jgi:hypothetical protein
MAKNPKELTTLPQGWLNVVEKRIHSTFPPDLHREALRILRRREAGTALSYMIAAGGKERALARFVKSLERCAYYAARPPVDYSFKDPRVASKIIRSVEIILAELPFLIDQDREDDEEQPCRASLLEVSDFVKAASIRRPGAPSPQSKYMCLLTLERFFRKWFGRPVHGALAAFAKATFPGDYHEEPSVNTIQIELGRARKLLLTKPA